MKRKYTQEERERKMRKYLHFKALGINDNDCANKLQISKNTIYRWKETEWFEDLAERIPWEENKDLTNIVNRELKRMLLSDADDATKLEVIDRVMKMNRGLNINKRPSGKEDNSISDGLDPDMFFRMRMGRDVDD